MMQFGFSLFKAPYDPLWPAGGVVNVFHDDPEPIILDATTGPVRVLYNNLNINDGQITVLGPYPCSIGAGGTFRLGPSGAIWCQTYVNSGSGYSKSVYAPDGTLISYSIGVQPQGGSGGEDGNDEGSNSGGDFGNGGGGSANYFSGQINAGTPTQNAGGTGAQSFSGEIAQGGTVDNVVGENGPDDSITGISPGGGAGGFRGAHGSALFLKARTVNYDSGSVYCIGYDGGGGGNGGNATSPDSDGIGAGGGGGAAGGNGGYAKILYHTNIGGSISDSTYVNHGSGGNGGFAGSGNGGNDGQDGNGGANGVDGTLTVGTY